MPKEIIYNKLVRDLIPEIIKRENKQAVTHIADDKEYGQKLIEKLREECAEFEQNPSEEELADILEVLYTLVDEHGFSLDNIEKLRLVNRKTAEGLRKELF